MGFKYLEKEKIKKLPKKPGVYCFKSKKEILYIGKAKNIRERVKNHFQNPGYKDYLFLEKIDKIGYVETDSEIEALILEANLIKKYQPKFNVIWRDSKNYFFVGMTLEDFPRIFLTHQKKYSDYKSKKFLNFVGPFVDGKALKETLKTLRKIFPFRSCKVLPKRPCLWYHLQRCLGPCILKTESAKEIGLLEKIKKECQKNAENVFKIIQGKKKEVLKNLKKEMKDASKKQEFEIAAKIRDQIFSLEKVLAHTHFFEKEKEENWEILEKNLRKFLQKEEKILKIEAFDISNISGKLAVGSMVTFLKGIPEKSLYRRFKIKFANEEPNDFEMLKEVLKRRFLHSEWEFPDLILIDGGKAHLKLAQKIKNEFINLKSTKIIAIAKKSKKIFVEQKKEGIDFENLDRNLLNFLLKINKEAHRFAISYHRKLRKKFYFDFKKEI